MNLKQLTELKLNSQEQYNIINNALQAANDNGFLDEFIFERALICYEVLELIEDLDESNIEKVVNNPLTAFDDFIEKGLVQELIDNYNEDVSYLADIAARYFEDYNAYLLSFGGAMTQVEGLSTDNLDTLTEQFAQFMQNDKVNETLQIADEWGLNRAPTPNKKEDTISSDSDNLLQLT